MPRLIRLATRVAAMLLLGLAAWEASILFFDAPEYLVPHASRVGRVLVDERSYFARHFALTLREAALGGAIGIVGGALTGALLANVRPLRWLLEPYLVGMQSFPREALAPVLAVWVGFSVTMRVVVSTLVCFFPMALASLSAFTNTPRAYVDLLRAQGASPWQSFLYARLPNAVPGLLGGAKVALPLAVIGAVIGEFIGGSGGLGYVIATNSAQQRIPSVFAALVLLALIGSLMTLVLWVLNRLARRRYMNHLSNE